MASSILGSIKKDSIRNIFTSICESEHISRAQIAKQTGLSLMTVGKAVDEFLRLGFAAQEKESKNMAGRKAGLVCLNPVKFFLILDLTRQNFQMIMMNSSFCVLDQLSYDFDPECYCEENLCIFLKNVKIYTLRYLEMEHCIGIGILVPGNYDETSDEIVNLRFNGFEKIKIRSIAEEILKFPVSYIKNDIQSAALSNIADFPKYREQLVSYVCLRNYVSGTLLSNGHFLGGNNSSGSLLGKISLGAYTLDDVISSAGLNEAGMEALSHTLYNLIWIVNPNIIIIENELPYMGDDLCSDLEKRLSEKLKAFSKQPPAIVLGNREIRHAHRGLAMSIRNQWIEELLQN